jgi:hypothetical protein
MKSDEQNHGLNIHLPPDALRPLVQEVVVEALAQLEEARAQTTGQLCYSEPAAARLLELKPWQLRDERLRGRIKASAIVGRRIRYLHSDLTNYLMARRLG